MVVLTTHRSRLLCQDQSSYFHKQLCFGPALEAASAFCWRVSSCSSTEPGVNIKEFSTAISANPAPQARIQIRRKNQLLASTNFTLSFDPFHFPLTMRNLSRRQDLVPAPFPCIFLLRFAFCLSSRLLKDSLSSLVYLAWETSSNSDSTRQRDPLKRHPDTVERGSGSHRCDGDRCIVAPSRCRRCVHHISIRCTRPSPG